MTQLNFQRDGAPASSCDVVSKLLENNFGYSWILTNGQDSYPLVARHKTYRFLFFGMSGKPGIQNTIQECKLE